jgi:hypothetical protein
MAVSRMVKEENAEEPEVAEVSQRGFAQFRV